MSIEIVRTSPDSVIYENHREDFETCPSCGHNKETREWFDNKYPIILSLDTGGYSIYSRAIIVSECDKCFEKSWVHYYLTSLSYSFDGLTKKQLDVITKEIEKRKLNGVRDFQTSLCCRCNNLTGISFDNFKGYRSCSCGSGGCEKKCKTFKSLVLRG